MNAKKMRRCKRALERVISNINAYETNRPINSFQRDLQMRSAADGSDLWRECRDDRLAKAKATRDALISKGVYVDKGR